MDTPVPGRTLTDEDVEVVATRLHTLLWPHVEDLSPKPPQKVEIVTQTKTRLDDANFRATAAVSDVTSENATLQDIPQPMINALLAIRARGGLKHGAKS